MRVHRHKGKYPSRTPSGGRTRKKRPRHKHEKRRYGTIKRGKVRFKLGSKQHKFLMFKKLPFSIVTVKNDEKKIKRVNV